MNRWIKIALSGLLILGNAYAQDDFIGPMDPARREQMEALRIWKMTEFLELSTEQSAQFFPRLKEFEDFIRENQDKQRDIMTAIYQSLKDKDYTASEKDVKKYARQLADLEKEILDRKEAFIISIGDVLTEEQQLRFIVFDNRFRNRLMRSIYQPHGPARGFKRERN